MEMPSPSESNPVNRIAPRFAFEAHIRIRLQQGDRTRAFGGWARDISESGISAFVAQALSVGVLVTLEVPLDESTELVISAKVARNLGTQYGFQFLALSAEQRAQIVGVTRGKAAIAVSNFSG
jgi:hypothetical protein